MSILRRCVAGVVRFGLGALPSLLILTTISQPILAADDCLPTLAAFSPGTWVASGITVSARDDDGYSTVVDTGQGAFRLDISETGDASGSISLVGAGSVLANAVDDQSGIEVEWMIDGTLSGNGTVIDIDGTRAMSIRGAIHTSSATSGDEFRGFGNDTSIEYHGSFSPSAANCTQVFGSLGGPAEYGVMDSSGESWFLAVRVGSIPNVDLEGQLVELMERAEVVLNMEPIDADILAGFVQDFLAFDSLLASLESCELAETGAGPAWQMLRSTLLNTAHRFLMTAGGGAYTTLEVVSVMTLLLQGGLLGLRGNECLEPNNPDGIGEVLDRFDEVLLARLRDADSIDARVAGLSGDIGLIVSAAYQYQLPQTIQYIEEFM